MRCGRPRVQCAVAEGEVGERGVAGVLEAQVECWAVERVLMTFKVSHRGVGREWGRRVRYTNNEVADTAFRRVELVVGSFWLVVTSKKFVGLVGTAAVDEMAPRTASAER